MLTIMTSFFYKTYLFDISTISPFYYNILFLYLILTLIICIFISLVIFYKETKIEIETLNYLYWAGYSKMKLNLIVLAKWTCIIIAGIAISVSIFILYFTLFEANYSDFDFLKIFWFSIPINILLFTGIILALIINRPLNELKKLHDGFN